MSRSTGPLRTILPAVAVGLAVLLAGCSAGQVTQTDTMEPAVNGNRGDVGFIALRDVLIAYPEPGRYREGDDAPLVLTIVNTGDADDELVSVSSPVAREVVLAGNPSLPGNTALQVIVPEEPVGTSSSAPSSPSPTGTTEPSLPEESVTEPNPPAETGEESAEPPPDSEAPPTLTGSPDSEVTETPTSPPAAEEIGTISIVLTDLTQDLPVGRNFPVTFVFANAGQITIQVPIAAPPTARPDPPATEDEGGH